MPCMRTKYGRNENGKKIEISDTQRYKMLGNAVSVPVVTMIGAGIIQGIRTETKQLTTKEK